MKRMTKSTFIVYDDDWTCACGLKKDMYMREWVDWSCTFLSNRARSRFRFATIVPRSAYKKISVRFVRARNKISNTDVRWKIVSDIRRNFENTLSKIKRSLRKRHFLSLFDVILFMSIVGLRTLFRVRSSWVYVRHSSDDGDS